jgi:peptide/nickel transport system substrate-binding protein
MRLTLRRFPAVVLLAAGMVLAPGVGPAEAETDRVVIVLDPPAGETNRFWGTGGGFGGLDPMFERLIGNDTETGVYDNSGVAESWETNDDFTEWTFHLHRNIEFHHGWGPLTAADIAHSYELHTADDVLLTGVHTLRGAEVEIIDDHTIRFTFPEPRIDFDFANAGRGSMNIYSKAQYDAERLEGYDRLPAGTGPYQYVERSPGRVLFERVENHWSGHTPDFPELEFRFTAEAATALALLLSGEAHVVNLTRELQPSAVAEGMEIIGSLNPSKQVVVMPNGNYLRAGDPDHDPDLPWGDVRVRQAMNMAIDRVELFEVLYEGRADLLVRYGMHEPHEGFVPELVERFDEEYGYDPERAKELLAEAGYPDAFGKPVIPIIATVAPGSPEYPTMAELLQVYFEAIGLQTEIREIDWAGIGAAGRGRAAHFIHPVQNSPIRPSVVALANTFLPTGSPYHGYEDDHMVALVERIERELDLDVREELIREAFTYAFGQFTDMPIASLRAEMTINPEVVGGWRYPGVTSNGLSHWHLIERAEQ